MVTIGAVEGGTEFSRLLGVLLALLNSGDDRTIDIETEQLVALLELPESRVNLLLEDLSNARDFFTQLSRCKTTRRSIPEPAPLSPNNEIQPNIKVRTQEDAITIREDLLRLLSDFHEVSQKAPMNMTILREHTTFQSLLALHEQFPDLFEGNATAWRTSPLGSRLVGEFRKFAAINATPTEYDLGALRVVVDRGQRPRTKTFSPRPLTA
jgi:hypothetical protein